MVFDTVSLCARYGSSAQSPISSLCQTSSDATLAGFAVKYTKQDPVPIFTVNFVAIVPTVFVLTLAVGEISIRVGQNLGELLNITFR